MNLKTKRVEGNALRILQEFLHNAGKLRYLYEKDKVRLMIPLWFLKKLEYEMREEYALSINFAAPGIVFSEGSNFMGFKMSVGYENSIVVFHEDYTLYEEPEMYAELQIAEMIIDE